MNMNRRTHLLRTGSAGLALVLLLTVVAVFSGCAGTSEIPDGYQYATCKGEYFRLFLPTQWSVTLESGVSGGVISLLDGTAVTMSEVFYEKPAAEGEDATATATLEDFFAHHKAQLTTLPDFAVEKELDTTLGSYRAKEIVYAATVGGVDTRYRQVLTKVEGRFYVFTYTSSAATFDQWAETVEGILEEVLFTAYPFEGVENEVKIPDVDTPDGMRLVTTNDVPYRFFAPTDWLWEEGSAASTVYVSEEDRSNVSVIGYVPDDEGYSVADYWESCEKHYKDALDDYVLTATDGEQTMGGRRATVYEFTYSLGGVTYKCRQTVCVFSYMIVTMTYTALEENYDAHLADAEAMQAAFAFRRN